MRRIFCTALLDGLLSLLVVCADRKPFMLLVTGNDWQPDNATLDPRGSWHEFDASELLVQYTLFDGVAFAATSAMPTVAALPAWQRMGGEPWARYVLAGRLDKKVTG